MKKLVFLFLAAGLIGAGCSKDEDEDVTPQSEFAGSWKKTKVEKRTSGGTWMDDTKTCHLDDVEEYQTTGAWTQYDGTDQCNAGSGVTKGTWKEAASGSKIVYTYDGAAGEYESTVEEITATTMILSFSTGTTTGDQQRTTYQKK